MLKVIKDKFSSGMGRDVVWTFSIQILIMLCSFAINKLLANRLSIDDFGQYNVIKRSVQVLSFVMLAGVGIALPRYIPLYRNDAPPRRVAPLLSASLIYILGVSLVVFLLSMLFSTQMQDITIGKSGNLNLLLIVLAYAFVLAIAQIVYAYYRGLGDFKWYNGTQLATQLSIILPLVALPVLTVTGVFESWLVVTALLIAYLAGRELWQKRDRLLPISTPDSPISTHLKTIVKYSSGRLVADFFQQRAGIADHSLFLRRYLLCHDGHTHLLLHGYHSAALRLTGHSAPRDGSSQPPDTSSGPGLCWSLAADQRSLPRLYQVPDHSALHQ